MNSLTNFACVLGLEDANFFFAEVPLTNFLTFFFCGDDGFTLKLTLEN